MVNILEHVCKTISRPFKSLKNISVQSTPEVALKCRKSKEKYLKHNLNDNIMSWSKVKRGKKPIIWWVLKIKTEFFYWTGDIDRYYHNLQKILKTGFNLYGEKL